MPNMGTTGTVNITASMMDAAIAAIADYQEQIKSLNTQLSNEVTGLIPSSFSGAAATGFETFFNNSILPNCTTNLTNMLDSLTQICTSIKNAIPGIDQGVDEQLGQGNSGAAGQDQ